jgi:hypothetical protein
MIDPALHSLLASIQGNDLDALLVLSDFLEERGDPRAQEMRQLYITLRDDWLFAPYSFRHFNVASQCILPLFPEYEAEKT